MHATFMNFIVNKTIEFDVKVPDTHSLTPGLVAQQLMLHYNVVPSSNYTKIQCTQTAGHLIALIKHLNLCDEEIKSTELDAFVNLHHRYQMAVQELSGHELSRANDRKRQRADTKVEKVKVLQQQLDSSAFWSIWKRGFVSLGSEAHWGTRRITAEVCYFMLLKRFTMAAFAPEVCDALDWTFEQVRKGCLQIDVVVLKIEDLFGATNPAGGSAPPAQPPVRIEAIATKDFSWPSDLVCSEFILHKTRVQGERGKKPLILLYPLLTGRWPTMQKLVIVPVLDHGGCTFISLAGTYEWLNGGIQNVKDLKDYLLDASRVLTTLKAIQAAKEYTFTGLDYAIERFTAQAGKSNWSFLPDANYGQPEEVSDSFRLMMFYANTIETNVQGDFDIYAYGGCADTADYSPLGMLVTMSVENQDGETANRHVSHVCLVVPPNVRDCPAE